MTEQHMTKEELIEWLDNAIDTETQKPTNEIDIEFVNECEKLINILMGNYQEYTDEDAENYFAEIKKKKAKKNTFSIRSKKVLAASVAIIVIFLGGFTVYASSPVVREFIHKTLNFNIGNSFLEDGITYINSGKGTKYKNIEDLIHNEGLTIKYPKYLPYDSIIKEIRYIENDRTIYFTFDDDRIQFSIIRDQQLSEGLIENAELTIVNNYSICIYSRTTCFVAYTIINNDLYTLQCDSKEELLNMINSIE